MTIETVTANRKAMAEQLAQLIGQPSRYMGVPSCAYQVGPYTINRDGSITGDDLDPIRGFLAEHEYIREGAETVQEAHEAGNAVTDADSVASADPEREPGTLENVEGMSVCIPLQEYTPAGLTNLLRILYARQKLINAMTQSDSISVEDELINRLADEKPDTVEKIQELLQDEISAQMVRGISIEDGKITMDFPFDPAEPTKWQAYAELLMQVEKHSRRLQHATSKKIEPAEGEMKYFCRNWLIQMGLGGSEHKLTRQILVGHLSGFAAFRSAEKMDVHRQRYAARRREAQEQRKAKRIPEMTIETEEADSND